ncbi:MAG: hypothetical protein KGL95_00775, partial [Patescibacteria group bacterium]|nr:hypothetical protein [Patescibacteria group bacterium]
KRLISKNDFETIIERITFSGLPTEIPGLNKNVILEKMHHDKKQEKGEIQWTLIKGLGEGIVNQHVSNKLVIKALEKVVIL